MRILFVSEELVATELIRAFIREGHAVRLYINNPYLRNCYDGIVEKTVDWVQDLHWVGKDGLIVFDDTGFGKEQDSLRESGYQVIGGCEQGDLLEENRELGQRILAENGIEPLASHNFSDPLEAKAFIQKHPEHLWVVKKNGGHISHFSYVTSLPNQEDALGILEQYAKSGLRDIHLQQKVEGIEVGIARYFNGRTWIGPIEFNIEHKGLMPGEQGPNTPEMGTVMWYEADESNRFFTASLSKLSPYLRSIGFRGDIDVNFSVSADKIYPFEFTARFGSPSTALQMELHLSPWGEFLKAVAAGEDYELKFKREFGVIVTVAVPPFPYRFEGIEMIPDGLPISFIEKMAEEELGHYYFEQAKKQGENAYEVSGPYGAALHVGGSASTLTKARKAVYERISKVHIPNMIYRHDIGEKFESQDYQKLKSWGWI